MTDDSARDESTSTGETSHSASTVASKDISIDAIVLLGSHYRDLWFERAMAGERASETDTEVTLSVTMQVLIEQPSRQSALVRLGITARPESPALWEANAEYVAMYSVGEAAELSIDDFAWSNGFANLVPFIRERIASLTQAGNYATYVLPPVSVAKLRELYEAQAKAERERALEQTVAP
jgi:preprotein translocase subunit SecB